MGPGGHPLLLVEGRPRSVDAPEVYAVVLLWEGVLQGAWVGWVATADGWFIRFFEPHLTDPELYAWLCSLPGWDPKSLRLAMSTPGSYVLWRNPGL